VLDKSILNEGDNILTIVGEPFTLTHKYEILYTDPGVVQVYAPAGQWKRKVFNGLGQIIVQSQEQAGEM
jgi:beta-galactosidase